jgi:DNA invertase Pin-like site-specific DNA recombinase
MRIFAYLRVSGKGQVEGDGPERQRLSIQAFAAKHGLELAGEGFDGGVSGTVEGLDRPEFARLILLCEKGDGIVVERLDRLARDLMVQELLLAECRKLGVQVFAADQGEPVDMVSCDGDPTRKLIRQILGALAEWEKSSLVFKLRVARQRVKAKTGRCEGAKPYGFLPGEKLVLDKMNEFFGKVKSYGRTARMLNEARLLTRGGTLWNRGTVWSLLQKDENAVEFYKAHHADAKRRTRTKVCESPEQRERRQYRVAERTARKLAEKRALDNRHIGSIQDFLNYGGVAKA